MDQEIVGDKSTWHIRLDVRTDFAETWCLYNGDKLESSPTIKRFAEQWMNDELEKENNG